MVDVTFLSPNGDVQTASGREGNSVMEVALHNDIAGILADCGGSLACATCHVHVMDEWLARTGRASEDELAMLELAVEPDANSRLSCQIRLTAELDGLVVTLPPSQF